MKDAVEQYLATIEQRNKARTVSDYRRLLGRHLVPKLGSRGVRTVTTHDVSRIIDALKATPSEQNHAHTVISIFFSWCARRDLVDANPIGKLNLPARTKPRVRALSQGELRKVWEGAGGITLGRICRLCILLGQRRSEIGSLKWDWIDQGAQTITFPAELMKNNREHTIPYGAMAEAIFEKTPRLGDFLFPGRDENDTFQGWAKSKRELDKVSGVEGWIKARRLRKN